MQAFLNGLLSIPSPLAVIHPGCFGDDNAVLADVSKVFNTTIVNDMVFCFVLATSWPIRTIAPFICFCRYHLHFRALQESQSIPTMSAWYPTQLTWGVLSQPLSSSTGGGQLTFSLKIL